MIFSWNRIFTSVIGGSGVFSIGTYFFTREGLEPSVISKIYTGEDTDQKWSILMEKLKNKEDKDLHNIFLKAKNGSGLNNLAQTCRKARKWTTSSLLHTNNLLESNAQEFCILRMIDIVKNDVIEITDANTNGAPGRKEEDPNKTKWDDNADNLITKSDEERGKNQKDQTLVGLFLLMGNKLSILKQANHNSNKHNDVKNICRLSYPEVYLPSRNMKLENIKTYCNKNPQKTKKQ